MGGRKGRRRCRYSIVHPLRVLSADRIPAGINIRIGPAREADRIGFDVAARPWVVVAEIVVMQVGRLVKELPREAEFVGEGAQWGAIAEGIMVPLPHDLPLGLEPRAVVRYHFSDKSGFFI